MPKVLIVDDNLTNVQVLAQIVSQIAEIEVVTYTDSGAALAWAAGSAALEPWLVIVDQNMPPPDGLTFVTMFKTMRGKADIPVVVVSEDGDREIRREVQRLGANATLAKPVDPVEFLSLIRNLLTARKATVQLINQSLQYAEATRQSVARASALETEIIRHLHATVEVRDKRSLQHMTRVARYAEKIAKHLGLGPGEIATLGVAASLHDIGKVAIPDRIYFRNSRLAPGERDLVKRHAQAGYDILKDSISPVLQQAAIIAVGHHEHFDGTGYPAGVRGEDIPLFARIVAVADVFAAITSNRPQRESLPLNVGIEEIERHRGSHFDPRIADAFKAALPEILEVRSAVPDLLTARA